MLALLIRHYYVNDATTGGLSSWWKGDVRLSCEATGCFDRLLRL